MHTMETRESPPVLAFVKLFGSPHETVVVCCTLQTEIIYFLIGEGLVTTVVRHFANAFEQIST